MGWSGVAPLRRAASTQCSCGPARTAVRGLSGLNLPCLFRAPRNLTYVYVNLLLQ